MQADVDAIFVHGSDGAGIDAVGFYSGAIHLYFFWICEMFQIPVGNLAAARIASAKDKDVFV
jgi:hypothetical protein